MRYRASVLTSSAAYFPILAGPFIYLNNRITAFIKDDFITHDSCAVPTLSLSDRIEFLRCIDMFLKKDAGILILEVIQYVCLK